MSDYEDQDFQDRGPGYYRVFYGSPKRLSGPYESVAILASDTHLSDYPDDGYVVHFDGEVIGSIPSLNPDDLCLQTFLVGTYQRFFVTYEVEAASPEAAWIAVLDNDSSLTPLDQMPCEIIGTFTGSSIEVADGCFA